MDTFKKYAISIGVTFASSFLTILGTTLITVDFSNVATVKIALASLLLAAVRGGIKAVTDSFVPVKLGGRKI